MLTELVDLQACRFAGDSDDPGADECRGAYLAELLYAALPGRDGHPTEALLDHVAAMRAGYGRPGDPEVADMRRTDAKS